MKRAGFLVSAGCVVMTAGAISTAGGAETASGMQDLLSVRASNIFERAVWLRGKNQYSLQFIPLRSRDEAGSAGSAARGTSPGSADRAGYFLGNTIANLRGVDPVFDPPRILALIDGRRVVAAGQLPQESPALRIQLWLLRADGTHIPATWNATYKLFSLPVADAREAVAAAIRINDEYYIEKLQSLEPTPVKQ